MNKEKLLLSCVTIGLLLIVVAIVLPIYTVMSGAQLTSPLFKYLYAAGALLMIIGRAFNMYSGKNLRIRRLVKIELWGAVFFCVAAFFLFYPPSPTHNLRDVLAFTLAGGAIQIYTSIMIPRVAKKEEES